MIRIDQWPPPTDWEEVVITWDDIMDRGLDPNAIYNWCYAQGGGRFHVHGYKSSEGFSFRFEHSGDAVFFRLYWL